MGPSSVDFGGDDLRPAIDLVGRFASPGDDITSWVTIEPVGVPDHLLPEVRGILGRRKRAAPPGVQVVYVDPARGPGDSVLSLTAPGAALADVLAGAGLAPPAGCTVETGTDHMIMTGDVGGDPGQLLVFAVAGLKALLGGWSGTFRATGEQA